MATVVDYVGGDGLIFQLPERMKARTNSGIYFCIACNEGMTSLTTAAVHVSKHEDRIRKLPEKVKKDRRSLFERFMESGQNISVWKKTNEPITPAAIPKQRGRPPKSVAGHQVGRPTAVPSIRATFGPQVLQYQRLFERPSTGHSSTAHAQRDGNGGRPSLNSSAGKTTAQKPSSVPRSENILRFYATGSPGHLLPLSLAFMDAQSRRNFCRAECTNIANWLKDFTYDPTKERDFSEDCLAYVNARLGPLRMNDHRRREIFREEYTRMRRDAYKSLHLKKIEIMKKALQARYESVNVQINVGDILDSRSVESASSPDVRDEDDQQHESDDEGVPEPQNSPVPGPSKGRQSMILGTLTAARASAPTAGEISGVYGTAEANAKSQTPLTPTEYLKLYSTDYERILEEAKVLEGKDLYYHMKEVLGTCEFAGITLTMATGKEDVYPSECKELREKLKAAVDTRKTTRRDKVRLAIQRDTMGALSILAEFARCGLKSADIPPFTDPRVREFLAESLFMISKYEERVKIFKDAEKDKKEEVITVDDDDDVKDDPFPPAASHSSAPTAGSVSSPPEQMDTTGGASNSPDISIKASPMQ